MNCKLKWFLNRIFTWIEYILERVCNFQKHGHESKTFLWKVNTIIWPGYIFGRNGNKLERLNRWGQVEENLERQFEFMLNLVAKG